MSRFSVALGTLMGRLATTMRAPFSVRTGSKARSDSWLNLLTQVGAGHRKTDFQFSADQRLPDSTLEDLFHFDPYAHRICTLVPSEALRQGFTVTMGDPETEARIKSVLDEMEAARRLVQAWTWARVFGGGALFVVADDGRDPREPLDEGAIRKVVNLIPLDRRELTPSWWYSDPVRDVKFGRVKIYRLSRAGGVNVDTREVHETRLLRFTGGLVTRRREVALQGWGESELQRVHTDLQQFRGAFGAMAALLQDASQGVYSIKDLATLMSEDGKDALKTRMELMDATRSIVNAVLLDAEGEKFEKVETAALTGYAEVVRLFILLLAGASGTPVTLLMGQSPAGMDATGESDIRLWYDHVGTEQETVLDPRLRRLVRLIMLSREGPTGGVEPDDWDITYKPLWKQTPKEREEERKAVAERDQIYIQTGVVTPEEIALSRFPVGGWSAETTIDLEVRKKVLEAEATEGAAQGILPKPPALPVPQAAPPPSSPDTPAKADPMPNPPEATPYQWVPGVQRGGPDEGTGP